MCAGFNPLHRVHPLHGVSGFVTACAAAAAAAAAAAKAAAPRAVCMPGRRGQRGALARAHGCGSTPVSAPALSAGTRHGPQIRRSAWRCGLPPPAAHSVCDHAPPDTHARTSWCSRQHAVLIAWQGRGRQLQSTVTATLLSIITSHRATPRVSPEHAHAHTRTRQHTHTLHLWWARAAQRRSPYPARVTPGPQSVGLLSNS
jgi:hypothetical protein